MENIFENILNDNLINPPESILNHFKTHFKNAINIEWFTDSKFYEAVFYEDDIEKIAKYDFDHNFINLKTNISADNLTDVIKKALEKYGEIMNCIKIENNDETKFEIIYRDIELNRFLLLISDSGDEIKKQKL